MFGPRHWMRHTAMVPKGFLRYKVLRLLNEKPMSGSELMTEIEKETDGRWRPSPGSIYPLLAWMQDKGYLKETEGEPGIKRYALTEQGKAFLDEHVKTQEELRERFRHLPTGSPFMEPFGPRPHFIVPPWLEHYPEKAGDLRRSMENLAVAVWRLRDRLHREYSEEAVAGARKALEEAAEKIEEITRKLQA